MSLYQCEKCGCVENTAKSNFHSRNFDIYPLEFKGKLLCSACGPTKFCDGSPTRFGKWHNRFERIFLPMNMFETNQLGNLVHKETGDEDYHKYRLPTPEGITLDPFVPFAPLWAA